MSGELGRVRGRKDIELLYDNLPEPIDRDLDIANRNGVLDRRGRSAARQHGQSGAYGCGARESRLMEAIGLALDVKGGRMFVTDFAGSVYSANLDGSNKKTLLAARGNLSGIAYVVIP